MKDIANPPVGFVTAVTVQAEQKGPREKTIQMQPGQTWQQVADEIGRTGLAWILVLEGMLALDRDPRIAAAPVPSEFVRAMIEVARHATLTDSAEEALLPVEELLPAGKLGVRSRKAHAIAASAPRKLWPHDIKKMQDEYARRVAAGEGYGAIEDLRKEYKTSRKTVSRHVKPKAKGK